jgi:hypothetical protein
LSKKDWGYYHVDCGHFPAQMKLCFDRKSFQKILEDHNITLRAEALVDGVAETHFIADGRNAVIIVVFDLDECIDEDPSYLVGVIAHEATHAVCRVFDHIGEQKDEIGEESRAYLTEHLVRQIFAGIKMHVEKNARKEDRATSRKKGKGTGGSEPQVDQHDQRSAGPDSNPTQLPADGGTEDRKGDSVGAPKTGVSATRKPGVPSYRIAIKGGSR